MAKEFENLSVEQIGDRINGILSKGRNGLNVTSTLFANYYPKGKKTFGNEGSCFVVSFSLSHAPSMDFDVYEDRAILPNPAKIKAACKKHFDAVLRDNRALVAKLDDGSGGEYVESLKKAIDEETAGFQALIDFLEQSFSEIRDLLEGEGFTPSEGSRLDETLGYERTGW